MKTVLKMARKNRQGGVVLLLSMVFLLLLAIVAGTVMQTSILEFFMAGNAQFREEAFQQAQAVVTEISQDMDNFPVTASIGYTVCPSGCDATLGVPTSAAAVPVGSALTYQTKRRGPLILESLPFRQTEDQVSSGVNFDAAIFEVDVAIDGSAIRLGSAQVVQGIAVRVVSSGQ